MRAATVAVATGLLLVSPQAALAAPSGTIVSARSGLCLDVKGASTTPGAAAQIYACHGNVNQQWEYTAAKELRTFGGSRCLDVHGASTQPQARVESFTCNGGQNQKWNVNADGTIVSAQSGLCLTVFGGGTTNGTPIDMYGCQGVSHQKWTVSAVSSDKTPPTPPGNTAVSILSCRSSTVSWSAATDNAGVTAYDIYRDGQLLTSVAGTARSTTVTTTPGANWGFYVNARDAAGNVSQASPTVQKQIPQCEIDTQPPTKPAGLRGNASGTSVTLNWTASTDNIGVFGYDVFRNNARISTTQSNSYVDAGLSGNTTYQYSVAARDDQDNVSPRSASISVKTGSSCSTPVCTTTQVTADTDIPWGLVQLPDGDVLYTRRDAHDVIRLNPATGTKTKIGDILTVKGTSGEGGLLGIAVTPQFPATDNWVYLMYTTSSDNRIVRLKYLNGQLDTNNVQVLLSGILRNQFHNGGRLRFGPDGKLYASTGDGQNENTPQDVTSLNGKVLRLNPDGSRPSDNPFGNYVWSYGHRNPQGLAFDSQGRLWEQEFGDGKQDETNMIEKGRNYGWPNCEGTSDRKAGGCNGAGFTAPKYTYPTAEGSCSGIAIVSDVIYVGCERGERMYRLVIDGSSIGNVQQFYQGTYRRIRTIEPSVDGGLWMTTSDGDKDSTADNSSTEIYKITLGQ